MHIIKPDGPHTLAEESAVGGGYGSVVSQLVAHDICINAQSHLQPFYCSLGFIGEGEEYMEDGIPHRKMRLAARDPDL